MSEKLEIGVIAIPVYWEKQSQHRIVSIIRLPRYARNDVESFFGHPHYLIIPSDELLVRPNTSFAIRNLYHQYNEA